MVVTQVEVKLVLNCLPYLGLIEASVKQTFSAINSCSSLDFSNECGSFNFNDPFYLLEFKVWVIIWPLLCQTFAINGLSYFAFFDSFLDGSGRLVSAIVVRDHIITFLTHLVDLHLYRLLLNFLNFHQILNLILESLDLFLMLGFVRVEFFFMISLYRFDSFEIALILG